MTNDSTNALGTAKNLAFTPSDTVIVLVDHQPGVLKMVHSLPQKIVATNAGVLARLGEEMRIPLVVTTTRENKEFLGTSIPEIQEAAPNAYAARIKRSGELNAFKNAAFVDAVKSTGRRTIAIAGVTTDVCLYHSVMSAIQSGYSIVIAADACGCPSELGDYVTYAELQARGAVVWTTNGILFQLYNNLETPEGSRAEAILGQAMPALASA